MSGSIVRYPNILATVGGDATGHFGASPISRAVGECAVLADHPVDGGVKPVLRDGVRLVGLRVRRRRERRRPESRPDGRVGPEGMRQIHETLRRDDTIGARQAGVGAARRAHDRQQHRCRGQRTRGMPQGTRHAEHPRRVVWRGSTVSGSAVRAEPSRRAREESAVRASYTPYSSPNLRSRYCR
jgi:hypothetical protein